MSTTNGNGNKFEPSVCRVLVRALTDTERRTLVAVADGKSSKEIASDLGVSPRTIESHLVSIFTKCQCHSRVEATRIALAAGVVS